MKNVFLPAVSFLAVAALAFETIESHASESFT